MPVYIGGYNYEDKTLHSLVWEEQRQRNVEKRMDRKWQQERMEYVEYQRNDNVNWFANCSDTHDGFIKVFFLR